ncbi:hypothetical protein [Actinomycetospora cinnamomea]|uniref:hypothetical protein n=1 Tax=Actinomycetospora cinnamomea TaxID=663609 RepID=UPI000E324AF3|nr:hypothetical protein [Actinomycetospora cinnamomea]
MAGDDLDPEEPEFQHRQRGPHALRVEPADRGGAGNGGEGAGRPAGLACQSLDGDSARWAIACAIARATAPLRRSSAASEIVEAVAGLQGHAAQAVHDTIGRAQDQFVGADAAVIAPPQPEDVADGAGLDRTHALVEQHRDPVPASGTRVAVADDVVEGPAGR